MQTPNLRVRHVLSALAVAAPIVLAAAGCASPAETSAPPPSPADEPAGGGTAVLGSISDVDSWNEYLSRQDFAAKLQRRIFLRLAVEQGDPEPESESFEPQLAESWEWSDDRLALTFHLRQARWSDGRPVTADDVRFTWEAQTDPAVAWINASTKRHITAVEVAGERSVRFVFDRRYPYQLADAVEGGILPRHVFGQVPFEAWRTHDWSAVSVGSGPFVLERHRPAEEIVLRRNPHFFRRGLPRVERVVIRVVPDAANLTAQLLSGDIDYFEGLAPRDAERLAAGKSVSLVDFDYPKYDFIGWNGARPPFDDPEVRRALTIAIDREALVEQALYGYGRVSRGPVLSFSWGADPTLEPLPYDPDEAARILARKGFAARGADEPASGDRAPLRIELLTNAGNELRQAMAVKIQEQLSRVGVLVTVRTLEMKTLVARCTAGDYDAYLGGWTIPGKIDLEPIFGSASRPPNGSNVVAFHSPEVDGLLRRLDEAEDRAAMRPLLQALQRRIHEEQPYTFLYETKRIAALGPRLSGMRIDDPADPLAALEHCRLRRS